MYRIVAVGTPVTRCPPHRSVREELPHTAPTLSIWRQSKRSLTHSMQSVRRKDPALYPVRGFLYRVPLGRCPFLGQLRRDHRPFVRWRLRYYGTVRLLGSMCNGRTAINLPHVVQPTIIIGGIGPYRGLPIFTQRASTHARFYDSAGIQW